MPQFQFNFALLVSLIHAVFVLLFLFLVLLNLPTCLIAKRKQLLFLHLRDRPCRFVVGWLFFLATNLHVYCLYFNLLFRISNMQLNPLTTSCCISRFLQFHHPLTASSIPQTAPFSLFVPCAVVLRDGLPQHLFLFFLTFFLFKFVSHS